MERLHTCMLCEAVCGLTVGFDGDSIATSTQEFGALASWLVIALNWGHGRYGAALSVAAEHAGASLNDLTDELSVDVLCGNAAFSGVPVTVTKA